jgi:pyruvate dehydrogenase E2 component (dihydrolipoamide acetyltransferase)
VAEEEGEASAQKIQVRKKAKAARRSMAFCQRSVPSAAKWIRAKEKAMHHPLVIALAETADKARAGKLSIDDMQGGGFTITNFGGIGGTSFTPIVNWPEVAILGISRGAREPVYIDGAFEPRLMLPLSLSYDHRVIDGADAARFLRWVAEAFEQPFVMSL